MNRTTVALTLFVTLTAAGMAQAKHRRNPYGMNTKPVKAVSGFKRVHHSRSLNPFKRHKRHWWGSNAGSTHKR